MDDPLAAEITKKLIRELRNKHYAEAYVAISGIIAEKCVLTQKEFSKRVGIQEAKLSRYLNKIDYLPKV